MKYFKILLFVVVVGLSILFIKRFWTTKPSEYPVHNIEVKNTEKMESINIRPISHATMALEWSGKTIITDPVGDIELYSNFARPDIVLLTDIHSDHLSVPILKKLLNENSILVMPKAVQDMIKEKLPGKMIVISNGEIKEVLGFRIEAVPMYNFPESKDSYHTKGRGNGYILEENGLRVYISGDTGNIPEMSSFKKIDHAFLSMNLPYTMSVEDAAKATLVIKPKHITPYHYRTPEGFSDIKKFKDIVNKADENIEVDLLNFYP